MKSRRHGRIMYMELQTWGGRTDIGPSRIGFLSFSQTGRTLYYRDHIFQRRHGDASGANYVDVDSGDEYWISGCKKNGQDRLSGSVGGVEIDEDIREEYWNTIRKAPERVRDKKS